MTATQATVLRYLTDNGHTDVAEMLGLIEPAPKPKPTPTPRKRVCARRALRPLNEPRHTIGDQYLTDPAERMAAVAEVAAEYVRPARRAVGL